MRFMEDLLRSSLSAAWGKESTASSSSEKSKPTSVKIGLPDVIDESDVKSALMSGRPEFSVFTNSHLGKIPLELTSSKMSNSENSTTYSDG